MTEAEEKQSRIEDLQEQIKSSKWFIEFNEDVLETFNRQLEGLKEAILHTESIIKKEKEDLIKYEQELNG